MMNEDVLAFFITWTCYGTYLPGDERGWTEWHKGDQLPQPLLEDWCRDRMTETAVLLDDAQRGIDLAVHVEQERPGPVVRHLQPGTRIIGLQQWAVAIPCSSAELLIDRCMQVDHGTAHMQVLAVYRVEDGAPTGSQYDSGQLRQFIDNGCFALAETGLALEFKDQWYIDTGTFLDLVVTVVKGTLEMF